MKLYDLNPSQEVVKLQLQYTLDKRVINIVASLDFDKPFDKGIMTKAYNKVVERNDCLRIRFVKKDKKLMQYFENIEDIKPIKEIPYYEFDNEKAQTKFLLKHKKRPIAYKKGVVVEPYFIKTFDNKYIVLIKICHMVVDIYGLNIIFKDLTDVYNALINKTELPEAPLKFEDVIINDIENKEDEVKYSKHRQFFENYWKDKEEPYFASLAGSKEPIFKKRREKNKRNMKMFFIKNKTTGYMHKISKETVDKAVELSTKTRNSLANILFYISSITISKINGDTPAMLPLELCNCRGTMLEKKCAGTKVQSIGSYTEIDQNKSFNENFEKFVAMQNQLYRHINFSDQEFEVMFKKKYGAPMLSTYYPLTFSLIPYVKQENASFTIYSNEKGSLPAYFALLYDINAGDIQMCYDVQDIITSAEDVQNYHNNYVSLINQITENPEILIKDLKVKL